MQINFQAKKLKEANKYVDLLHPKKIKPLPKIKEREELSFIKKNI